MLVVAILAFTPPATRRDFTAGTPITSRDFAAGTPVTRREFAASSFAAFAASVSSAAVAEDSVQVTVLTTGDTSTPLPQRAQKAVVDYTLWIDGFEQKQIDTSKGTAFPPRLPSPFKFGVGVGEVIPGYASVLTRTRTRVLLRL